ncbi:unnamed protein product [Linum tenue]|uniref:Uncharacterized protein n=1 Tax=Linum tenue TaxID=586396 RepID=A0AAV0NL96_9ROSI|nr:unnamed protein product [Linum tenue]
MLENPTPAATPADSSATIVKKYAPPNQRNRPLNRRKSGDRIDRFSSLYGNDGDKIQTIPPSRNILGVDQGDAGIHTLQKGHSRRTLVALEGCCHSDASQLLNDRWATVMHIYNDPTIDLSERPVLYSGGVSAWGQFKLPHQMMPAANSAGSSGSQMDFLSELRRAMHNANTGSNN